MSFHDLESGVPPPGLANGRQQDPSSAAAAVMVKLATAVNSFRNLVYSLCTPNDTPQEREKLHQKRQQIGQLAKDVSAILEQASERDQQSEVSALNFQSRCTKSLLIPGLQRILKQFWKIFRKLKGLRLREKLHMLL